MQRTFILHGERIDLVITSMKLSTSLVDVTTVGSLWKEWATSSHPRLELQGATADGVEVDGVFEVLSQPEVGVLEISIWTEHPVVGNGE